MDTTNRLPYFTRLFTIFVILVGLALPPGSIVHAWSYTVNSLEDTDDGLCSLWSNGCTLREAMNRAKNTTADDTITFGVSGTISLTATLPMSLINSGDLTIDGAGSTVIISGNKVDRNFYVIPGTSLTLRNLTIRNGYATTEGAGIYNDGALTVDHTIFSFNEASGNGGAIYSIGPTTITNSTFSHNYSDFGKGGALYVAVGERVTIDGSSFLYNTALLSGGAIYSEGYLTIAESEFILNSGLDGGGIGNDSFFSLRMKDSTLWGNSASRDGGGLYHDQGDFIIENCIFNYNTARDGGGAKIDTLRPTSTFTASEFNYNTATRNGGAIMNGSIISQLIIRCSSTIKPMKTVGQCITGKA